MMALGIPPALLLRDLRAELAYRGLELFRPYAKQRAFFEAGRTHRERAFLAGNQLGKTRAGGIEAAMHLTGRYPDWWQGRRWDRPTVAWAGSDTGETTRDTVERMLMGRAADRGSGTLPADSIADTMASRGAADALASVRVRHVSGGTSSLVFKTYDQGRSRWQGETLDWVWLDEEPPAEIYDEALTRTNATGGMLWLTATPLLGMTEVVGRFWPAPKSPDRHLTVMTIDDAEHYTPAERTRIVAAYPEHEREARAAGIPTLGSGRVFPIAEALLREEAARIPAWWRRIVGLDLGHGDHPTAATWVAFDPETDTAHVYDAYRNRAPGIEQHAAAIRQRGAWIPVAWPHDGMQPDRVSGTTIAQHYRAAGLNMLPEHATHPDGGIGVEAGLLGMYEMMAAGRWKVAAHLSDWWEEYRTFHRRDGKVVKLGDDLMSASRAAHMMQRHARTAPDPRALRADPAPFNPHEW